MLNSRLGMWMWIMKKRWVLGENEYIEKKMGVGQIVDQNFGKKRWV